MNETMYYSKNRICYLESIVELIKVSSSTEHQSAETYPWKWHIPMKAQIYYNRYEKHRLTPIATLKATTIALSSGSTDKTINDSEYILTGEHPFNVFTPLVYSALHKTNSQWKNNSHEHVKYDRIDQ